MQSDLSLFLHSRIESIMTDLRKNHAEYAVAWTRRRELFDRLDPIFRAEGSLTHADYQNLRGYMEQDFIVTAAMEEELYRQRLDACMSCDHLISGVCMKCGCYVEFRAAFKGMKCPNVKDRKW